MDTFDLISRIACNDLQGVTDDDIGKACVAMDCTRDQFNDLVQATRRKFNIPAEQPGYSTRTVYRPSPDAGPAGHSYR